MNSKKDVREKYISDLLNVDKELKNNNQQQLYQQLFANEVWINADVIGVTISSDMELDTSIIIEKAKAAGKQIVIPRTLPKRQMEFVELTVETKYQIKFHIKEPINGRVISKDKIDLMVVPGLAFAANGYRIGFGGGYYDRYLADFENDTIALCLNEQKITNDFINQFIDSFDIKIKQVLMA